MLSRVRALASMARALGLQIVGRDPRVPDLELAHPGVLEHALAVGVHGGQGGVARALRAEARVARRQHGARREALDVPFERPRQGLVEVVDVEQQRALGRREQAEVGQVGVAAELRREAAVGQRREVGGHDGGRAAEVGEGRYRHAPVADRYELRDPAGVALPQ
jgi:hypothetical protein